MHYIVEELDTRFHPDGGWIVIGVFDDKEKAKECARGMHHEKKLIWGEDMPYSYALSTWMDMVLVDNMILSME